MLWKRQKNFYHVVLSDLLSPTIVPPWNWLPGEILIIHNIPSLHRLATPALWLLLVFLLEKECIFHNPTIMTSNPPRSCTKRERKRYLAPTVDDFKAFYPIGDKRKYHSANFFAFLFTGRSALKVEGNP